MNITLSGTKVSMDGHTLAFQKNNLVDSMVITVDTDETWQYKLDVKYPCKDSKGEQLYNVIDLTRVGNTCKAILQSSMLPFNGKYIMQLRGISGDKVYHTDTFDVWVKYSIDPGKVYDPVPSEFYQIEQAVTEQAANAKQSATESAESATNAAASATKAENAVVHSPIVGENGNWFIWDFTKSEYVDSGNPASIGGGTDLSLGITGATVGQIAKITAVDTNGKPTAWEAATAKLANPNALTFTGAVTGTYDGSAPLSVEIPSGGSGGSAEPGYKDATTLFDVTLDDTTGGLKQYEYDVSGIEKTDVIIINILFPQSYQGQVCVRNQDNYDIALGNPYDAKGMVIGLKAMNGRYMHSCVYSSNTSARVEAPLSLFYGQLNGASGFEGLKEPDTITKLKFILINNPFVSGTRIRAYRW